MAADTKAKLLQGAERYVLHGKVQQAIEEYLKIVKVDPNDVLILNTIGDLYLRQGNSAEANKYFSRVAENYVQNNFFLKAIAVYKKILTADPDNLEINATMASLYAKQGLTVEAKNQYLRIASLYEKQERGKEAMDAYESIVELDPSNSAVRRKLAGLYSAEGVRDKAHQHWAGAGRAQAKAGDLAGAVDSFGRACDLKPLDADVMREYLDCCLSLKDPAPALKQLKASVEAAPDNLELRDMLGKACLAAGDPEAALKAFKIVFSMDEARYGNLFDAAQAFVEREDYDQALNCVADLIPILISRRETTRARQLYEQILQRRPDYLPALEKMASLFTATGERAFYLDTIDKIARYHEERKHHAEALEYVEEILRARPDSEEHQKRHFDLFAEAYPGTPYVTPVQPHQSAPAEVASALLEADTASKDGSSGLVEVDLLINYGLKEKALNLLLSLEARDPYDKEVRQRLLNLYKADQRLQSAAEQCLLLAALNRRAKNEEAAQSFICEAKQLAPEMEGYAADLDAFASKHGIETTSSASGSPAAGQVAEPVDLSSDLLDIFFSGNEADAPGAGAGSDSGAGDITEPFLPSVPVAAKPIEEQLQEVDFYIRLGFNAEALTKLNEIARVSPGNPELASRYEKLGETEPSPQSATTDSEASGEPAFGESAKVAPDSLDVFHELDLESTLDSFAQSEEIFGNNANGAEKPEETGFSLQMPEPEPAPGPAAAAAAASQPDFQVNEMFADLMDEAGGAQAPEASGDSFEEHFSLGTAYRDMDLHEEAIREFELALKAANAAQDGRRIVQCCGMLSACSLKKGMPSSAVRWCQTGLKVADISSHEAIALRYDMGVAHSMSGSNDRALECFDQIFDLDPGYRDVAQRIDELKGGFRRHAP